MGWVKSRRTDEPRPNIAGVPIKIENGKAEAEWRKKDEKGYDEWRGLHSGPMRWM